VERRLGGNARSAASSSSVTCFPSPKQL
jgi:hypothetical protein